MLALLFIVLLVAWFGDDDGPKRQTGAKHGHSDRSITYFPNANRTLEDVQSKLRRIQGATKRTTPAPSPQQPRSQEHRPPSAAPRVPETPKAESHRPASKQAAGSVNRDGQPGRLLQTEIPLVDEPLDGLPGGRYVDWSPDGKVLLTSTGSGKARLWDVPTWRGINFKLPNGQESDVIQAQSAVFSPHETKLATFAINDTLAPMNPPVLRVWDLETRPVTLINKVEVRKVTGMNAGGLWPGLVWSANGDTLVSGRPGTMSGGSRGPGGGLLFLGEEGLKGQYVDSSPELWMHVSVSPNGQLAVMATDQPRTAKVIAVPEGKSIKTIPLGKHSWTYQLYSDFSPDGKLFAATFEEEGTEHNGGGDETTVRLFDTSTWEQRSVLPATEGEVSFHFAAFSPDSKLLATAAGSTWDNTVTLWDVQTGKKIREFETKCPRVVLFSPDSSTMVTGGNTYLKQDEQYNVDFWDVATGRPKARIVAGKTYALALSPSQHFLVTGDMDEHAWLWDLTTLHGTPHVDQNTGQSTRIVADQQRRDAPVEDIPEPEHATTRPAQSPQTSKPQIVNLAMPKSPLPIGVHDGGVTGMAVSPDGKLLVTAGHYGDIKIWSLPEGKPLKRIENANVGGVMVAIGPDGRQLVTVGARKYPKLWSLPDGERMKTLHWEIGGGVFSAANIGAGFVGHSTMEHIEVRSFSTGKLVGTLSTGGRTDHAMSLDISKDGRLLASGHIDGKLRLWSLSDRKLLQAIDCFEQAYPRRVAMNPSADKVAAVCTSERPTAMVTVWAIPNGRLTKVFRLAANRVTAITFAADDLLLFAELGAVRIVSLKDNKIVGTLVEPRNFGRRF